MDRASRSSASLRHLLEAAGYRLEDRAGALLAFRPRDRRGVVVVAGLRSPAELEPLFASAAVHRTVIYAEEPGPVARSLAAERGIEVLDPATLGPALGELLLPSPLDPESPPPLDAPAVVVPEAEQIVRPRLGRREAESLSGVDGYRYTLRLVPFYVAPYRVRSTAPHGGVGPVTDHLVAVNAATRRAEIWEAGDRELVPSLSEPSQRLEPQVSQRQALEIAVDVIRRYHTVNVDHTEQHGGALVIETRKVPPATDDIRLGPAVLVRVPYWYVESSEGRVVLDAVTGRRVAPPDAGGP